MEILKADFNPPDDLDDLHLSLNLTKQLQADANCKCRILPLGQGWRRELLEEDVQTSHVIGGWFSNLL